MKFNKSILIDINIIVNYLKLMDKTLTLSYKNKMMQYIRVISVFIALFLVNPSIGQQLWLENFDGSNSTNPPIINLECGPNGFDYFGIGCCGTGCGPIEVSSALCGFYQGEQGNFLGAYNTDSAGAGCDSNGSNETAEWSGINISSCTGSNMLYLCFEVAALHNSIGTAGTGWDGPSQVLFNVSIDGGPYVVVSSIQDQGTNSNPAFQTDCNVINNSVQGDGILITEVMTEYCVQIPGMGGNSLDLLINIDGLNEPIEDIIIDNISVHCEPNDFSFINPLGCGCEDVFPTFNPIASQCEGEADPLPLTSLEGYTGTWSPVFDPNNTTTYTFTPTAGFCLSDATLTVDIEERITPTFDQLGPYCQGDIPDNLPLTSTNVPPISGTWDGSIDTNTPGTQTFTFTPNPGECAETTTMMVVIATGETPTFTQLGPYCQGETPDVLPTSSNDSPPINGTWDGSIDTNTPGTQTFTFTPNPGECGAMTTMMVVIESEVTPTFTQLGPYCQGETPDVLPTSSNDSPPINGTWDGSIDTNTPGTQTFNFTPDAGECAAMFTMMVTVETEVVPTFTQLGPYCQGETADLLPTSSNDSPPINGTWDGSIDTNTPGTQTFTFTPDPGGCNATTTMMVVVEPEIVPTFTQLGPYCQGETADLLPTSSNNSPPINGTWDGSIDTNTPGTQTFTFTPDPGGCNATTTMMVIVEPEIVPTFTQLGPYCQGETADLLPTSSNNSPPINGTWDASIDTNTPGNQTFTFTPDPSECATMAMMTVFIETQINPTFDPIPSQCAGESNPLVTVSLEGVEGTWSPTFDPDFTNTYTFTPDLSECATTTMVTVTIDQPIIPDFTDPPTYCELDDQIYMLQTTSGNGINGTWTPSDTYIPALLPVGVSVFTFTPDANECAEEVTININVEASDFPDFTQLGPYCVGDTPDILPVVSLNGISGSWDGPISTSTPGTINYTFTPDNGTCAVNTTMSILIEDCGCTDPAIINIDPIGSICEDETLSLSATIGGSASSITWSGNGDGFFDDTNAFNPIYTPGPSDIVNGMVTITATTDDPDGTGPCSAANDQVILTINLFVTPLFTQLGPYCQGETPDNLPLTSLNGITGTWNSSINTSIIGSSEYIFTPDANECAVETSMTIQIDEPPIATFNTIPNQCAGDSSPLPTESIEGFTGTWSPIFDPNITSTYTFIVDDGQCASDGNVTVNIDPQTLPNFTQLGPYCVDDTPDMLPIISLNGINGTWDGPISTSNPGSSIYTFTPNSEECAMTTTMEILINDCGCTDPATVMIDPISPICENETLSLVANIGGSASIVTWSTDGDGVFDNLTSLTPIYTPGANDIATGSVNLTVTTDDPDGVGPCSAANASIILTITVQESPEFTQLGPYCIDDTPDTLPMTSLNGINGTWDGLITTSSLGSSIFTFTPDSGECASVTTMQIVVNDCGCNDPAEVLIDPISSICENETISLVANISGSASMVTWTSDGDGLFDNNTSLTPIYTPGVGDILNGSVNLSTTTDDPDDAGPCPAVTASVLLTIIEQEEPQFTQLGPYCVNDVPDMLPMTSLNGISGDWDSQIETLTPGSTIYTFTPTNGACALISTMQIVVNDCGCADPAEVTIDPISEICENESISLIANIAGSASSVTWSSDGDGVFDNITSLTPMYTPGANDISNGSANLTVTTDDPDGSGPCTEAIVSVLLNVNNQTIPQFDQLGPYCVNDNADTLPITSLNGISGIWDGPITTTSPGLSIYTFTPENGECATTTTMQIEINDCGCADPAVISIDPISAICENETISLTANISGSASMVTWSSDGNGTFDNTTTLTPTYSPGANDIANGSVTLIATTDDPDGAGPCSAASTNVILTINTEIAPQFSQLGPYCVDEAPDVLPSTSLNGITGTWDGPITTNIVGSTTYTFTPNQGQCASVYQFNVDVESCDCSGAITVELPCDDNDPCTINDISIVLAIDSSECIPCMGTFVETTDSENDKSLSQQLSSFDETFELTATDLYDNWTAYNGLYIGDSNLPIGFEVMIDTITGTIIFTYESGLEGEFDFFVEICNEICGTSCFELSLDVEFKSNCFDVGSLSFPSGFTPNGDGINDVFRVSGYSECNSQYQTNELIIWNRWGNVVFSEKPYQNEWDGTDQSGKALPEGTYYYSAVFDNSNGVISNGYIVILR